MKKIVIMILALIFVLGAAMTVLAVEVTTCTVTADSVTGAAGAQIAVPVRITSNQGFTNFGIALDYDRDALELVSIAPSEACGELVSTSIAWDPSADANAAENEAFTEGVTYGYITCASPEVISGDGVFFTATFKISESFSGTAAVTPVVSYMRNNSAMFSMFEEITAEAAAGTVSLAVPSIAGDLDGSGAVDMRELLKILSCYSADGSLTAEELANVDANGNGAIDLTELMAVLRNY